MRKPGLIVLLFLFFGSGIFACQCPPSSLSLDECAKYEIIFRGRIDSLINCDERPGEIIFEVIDLYKGAITKKFRVIFDCKAECAQPLQAGEEWIIYANFKQVTNARLDWCSRSRKFFAIDKQDFYSINLGNTYEQEHAFLASKLGTHRPVSGEKKVADNRNLRPSMTQTVVTLICSLLAMIGFYWFLRKNFHRF